MPRAHIAIDASRATRARRTGTEQYARQTIQRLVTRHPEARWTLFFRDDPGPWLADLPHVERVVLPRPHLWTYTALAPALLRERPDAFWEPAHVLPPTAPLTGIPSLVCVHDLGYEYVPDTHPAPQRHYLRLTTRYHARAATHVAALSRATRHDLLALYGADPARVSVVYPGVDHDHFRPIEAAARLEAVRARYSTGKRFLLYVGTLQPRKNVPRLVRAFARVARSCADVRLVLAGGQGWLLDDLQGEIERLGLADRVVRPGYVPHDDLPALLTAAEALVFPSLFEGFGLPVLEAMACGTPVLASMTPALAEAAADAALLVDPLDEQQMANALHLLLTQPSLRAALRERGLRRAAQFSWERTADDIWALLKTLVDAPSPRGTTPRWGGARVETTPREHPQNQNSQIEILKLPIDNLSWAETLDRIAAGIEAGVPQQVVTVNPEFLMRARRDPAFWDVLRRADLVLADGVGLLLAARWQGDRFKDRITGSDLTPRLAAAAARRGWRLYLLGAGPGVAAEAARRLRAQHPTLDVWPDGSDPAPDGPPALLDRIRAAQPDLLLVAYGAPKQDLWIDRFKKRTGVPVQIGIGGALDFVAGVVPRAPDGWQRLNLEWLWRLKEEPWRWRRMLALPHFALLAALDAGRKRVTRYE